MAARHCLVLDNIGSQHTSYAAQTYSLIRARCYSTIPDSEPTEESTRQKFRWIQSQKKEVRRYRVLHVPCRPSKSKQRTEYILLPIIVQRGGQLAGRNNRASIMHPIHGGAPLKHAKMSKKRMDSKGCNLHEPYTVLPTTIRSKHGRTYTSIQNVTDTSLAQHSALARQNYLHFGRVPSCNS